VAPHVYVAEASALEDSTVLAISADEVEDILLREPAAGYAVMKKVAGVISTRLRDIKEELIEVLES
jgi:CRP-like cAMP-binding protein